jgi:hypothetical protein
VSIKVVTKSSVLILNLQPVRLAADHGVESAEKRSNPLC